MSENQVEMLRVGEAASARDIAVLRRTGAGPGLFWLGGFASDMRGSKAEALDGFAATSGRAFTRFDYSGHGASGGAFAEGTISRWLEEARAVGRHYGREMRAAGASIHDTVEAFLFFRRSFSQLAAPLPGIAIPPDLLEAAELRARIDDFMDAILLGTIAGFEEQA